MLCSELDQKQRFDPSLARLNFSLGFALLIIQPKNRRVFSEETSAEISGS